MEQNLKRIGTAFLLVWGMILNACSENASSVTNTSMPSPESTMLPLPEPTEDSVATYQLLIESIEHVADPIAKEQLLDIAQRYFTPALDTVTIGGNLTTNLVPGRVTVHTSDAALNPRVGADFAIRDLALATPSCTPTESTEVVLPLPYLLTKAEQDYFGLDSSTMFAGPLLLPAGVAIESGISPVINLYVLSDTYTDANTGQQLPLSAELAQYNANMMIFDLVKELASLLIYDNFMQVLAAPINPYIDCNGTQVEWVTPAVLHLTYGGETGQLQRLRAAVDLAGFVIAANAFRDNPAIWQSVLSSSTFGSQVPLLLNAQYDQNDPASAMQWIVDNYDSLSAFPYQGNNQLFGSN